MNNNRQDMHDLVSDRKARQDRGAHPMPLTPVKHSASHIAFPSSIRLDPARVGSKCHCKDGPLVKSTDKL